MYDFNQFLNQTPTNVNNPNIQNPQTAPIDNGLMNSTPMMQGPCCVQNKTFCQYVPQPCNFHTHTVNTVIRKRYVVPTYTNSEETVFVDDNPCCNRRRNLF